MAEWKKIVVSGSDISQLNNDSGYLTSGGTIDSASVAARATELSADATASFADLASNARTADSASVAARATELSADATASFADVAGTSRNADSASVAARATTLSSEATASHALTAVTASHALNVPDTASHALTAVTASIADELSQLATASFALVAGDARNSDSASVAARATELSADATASFADLASDARTATSASFATQAGTSRNADSASVAARATELSADATASFADLASTVHDGNITTAKIADSNVTNAKLQNDSITFGTTAQALGSTVTSISGLTSISATTGSFVLQIFESSSTIITSGSNIFGDQQDDIQQITGSLTQTGSFVLSGSLLQSHGTISGSFVGDGSGLTGLATNLTVDGDTGTQNVNLIDDDLQFLGTTDRIDTTVTKVGNDVKVTFDLPDTVEVTASVATRANELSPLATASFADLASSARNADSASVAARATTLSSDATASFADLASSARNADSASVAARATTLSAEATASIADFATSASIATSATSASATVAGVLFPVADGITNQALVTDGAGQFTYGDIFGTGSTKKLNQSVAAATWSFAHSLNELYPIVQVYDSTGDQIIPERVESIDVNNVKLYFAEATAGVAAAMVGGMGISASNATRATSASIADEASTLSATATASFSLLAGTVHDGNITTAKLADDAVTTVKITDANVTTAKIADDAVTATKLDDVFTDGGGVAGTFGSTTQIPRVTIDAQGRITTASLETIATDFNIAGDSGTDTVNGGETLTFSGTSEEIVTAVTNNTVTFSLPSNVTVANDLTVTNNATIAGDLVVGGSIVSASSLAVEDQFIILASGSNGAIDGGIIINQIDDHPDGKGTAFAYDSSANRWALETGLNDTASVITPDAYMGVIQEGTFNAGTAPLYGSTAGKGTIFVDDGGDIYIYG